MKILLTETEIKLLMDSVYPSGTGTYRPTPFDLALCQAQLKKVVEYIDTLKFYDDFGGQSGEFVARMIKKALLQEVEG